jgi:DNA-binding response OmpR family regulator
MFLPPVPALPHPPPLAETPHVLLVEADAGRAYRISCALSRRGAQCTVLGDGLESLLEARRMRPSAVVLGDFLPWLSPETICRSLRAAPETAGLPVIALGDGARPRQRHALEAAGAHWLDSAVPFEERLAAYLVPVPVATPPEISGISASYGGVT